MWYPISSKIKQKVSGAEVYNNDDDDDDHSEDRIIGL